MASYYGKKDKEQKAEIIQAFKEGEKKIIVATKAFGMGVDISDIDRVYHVAPSSTFVDYIQEIEALIAEEKPPECIHKNTCKKCAYYDLCTI